MVRETPAFSLAAAALTNALARPCSSLPADAHPPTHIMLRTVLLAAAVVAANAGVSPEEARLMETRLDAAAAAAPDSASTTTHERRLQGALDLDICTSGNVITNDVGTVHDDQDETDGAHDHVDCTTVRTGAASRRLGRPCVTGRAT
jgi:hypothetical protein